jgi:hypothetical protein
MDKLPSLWQIDDQVSLTFPGTGILSPCKVTKVSFNKSDVLYDVEVPFRHFDDAYPLGTTGYARLHGLKEWHLRIPTRDDLPA